MTAKPFFDTNVLVYAFTTEEPRAAPARELVLKGGRVSVQVFNEFVNVARRKLHRDWADICAFLALLKEQLDEPMPITSDVHRDALDLAERYNLSFYESLIVAAASRAGCSILYSEDMDHGSTIAGVTIRNPFLPA